MNKNKCCIAVPIYKTEFNYDEFNSVTQLFKILGQYDIVAYCPNSLDTTYYQNNFNFKAYYEFWDEYFDNYPWGYNKLMLQSGFYEQFSEYEYMLVYQPDCWVFRDELEYWCDKGYDYIGAPFYYITYGEYLNDKLCQIGNGGFSLRKISWWINACNKYKSECDYLWSKNSTDIGEDHLFAFLSQYGIIDYNVPPLEEAVKFAFETDPEISYILNNRKLPFGCHAYNKIEGKDFYQVFNLYKDKKLYSVVTYLFGDYDILRDPDEVDEDAEYICITDRKDLKSDVWKFVNLKGYDLSKYNDWQKTLIARYSALDYINTNICVKFDASIHIKKSIHNFIINEFSDLNDINNIYLLHPWRDSYLEEYDEWINKRNLDKDQKDHFIKYCDSHNYNYNMKGMIMTTIMMEKNNEFNKKMNSYILNELMNINDFNIRVDQTYFSIIFTNLFFRYKALFLSMQVLQSDYFEYFYHGKNYTHDGEYKCDLSNVDFKYLCNRKLPCLYML